MLKTNAVLFMLSIVLQVLTLAQTPKNQDDRFTIRTGVNVSHWLSQNDNRGAERKKYITKADLDTIAACGFDHIRLPLDEVQLWDSLGNQHKEAFKLMHNAIKWALAAKLRVIVDLHIIRSHYFNAASNKLWTDPAEQQKLVNMWRQLSKVLKKYPVNMLAYEIMNEAVADNPEDWNKLFNKVISDIRKKEPNRVVVIGSNKWQIASTFPDLRLPENDKNIILSFHFYTPLALTHHLASWTTFAEYKGPVNYPGWIIDTANYKGLSESTINALRTNANGYFTKDTLEKIMAPAIKFAKEKNLQLYCGEYGVYPTIAENLQLQWYKDMCDIFHRNNIAYCHWCYKGDFPVVNVKTRVPNKKLVAVLTSK
jgi:endoglucanase